MMAIDDWFSQVRRSRHPAMQLLKPHPVRSGRWLRILKTFCRAGECIWGGLIRRIIMRCAKGFIWVVNIHDIKPVPATPVAGSSTATVMWSIRLDRHN